MTTTVHEDTLTVVAAQDLNVASNKYKAITVGGTIAASAALAIGLLITSVTSGGHASAVYQGITKGWAAAAVTSGGVPLTVTTSGYLAAANSGDYTVGRALEPASSGDLFRVAVDFSTLGYKVA